MHTLEGSVTKFVSQHNGPVITGPNAIVGRTHRHRRSYAYVYIFTYCQQPVTRYIRQSLQFYLSTKSGIPCMPGSRNACAMYNSSPRNPRIRQSYTFQPDVLEPFLTMMDLPTPFSMPKGTSTLALVDCRSACVEISSPRKM